MQNLRLIQDRLLLVVFVAAGYGIFTALSPVASGATDLGPVAVIASADGTHLFVANSDARQLAVVDTVSRNVVRVIEMPSEPTAMVLSPDGKRLYVTCAAPKSTVCVVDAVSCNVVGAIPAGHTVTGLAMTPDGKQLYVCNRFNNDVSVIDLESAKEIVRIPVVREPVGAVTDLDGRSVFVINHLPLDRADSGEVAAVVTVIDTAPGHATTAIRLPNGSSSVRDVCMSPDGKHVYVSHILSRYQMPTTQLDRGWMNTNALSIIDVQAKNLLNTVLLDDVEQGAANPWGVAMTGDGRQICVTHAGTQELSVIDAPGLLDRLMKLAAISNKNDPNGPITYGASLTAADVPNELSFLVGLRRRVPLQGIGARGLAIVGSTAFVAEYFTDTLTTVELSDGSARPVEQIALGPRPTPSVVRRGQMLFQNADLCFQHWQSCESCHPGARVDGLNWDLLNDGIGNPKNTRTMLLAYHGGPVMWLGVREDAPAAVRAGVAHIQFTVRPEEEARAIDEYLKSLQPIPSPHLVDGRLSPAAERGKKVFLDRTVGCARCHPEPDYSDQKVHDVGSASEFDRAGDDFTTPKLVEVWRTAPYLHDGRYPTLKELIVHGRHGDNDGTIDNLSEQQIDDLIEFVLSL